LAITVRNAPTRSSSARAAAAGDVEVEHLAAERREPQRGEPQLRVADVDSDQALHSARAPRREVARQHFPEEPVAAADVEQRGAQRSALGEHAHAQDLAHGERDRQVVQQRAERLARILLAERDVEAAGVRRSGVGRAHGRVEA